MALEFYLIPNLMTADPDDYMAVSRNAQSYGLESIYDDVTREGSTVTKAEALANFEAMVKSVLKKVQEGHAVVTPFFSITSAIGGVFNSEDEAFNKNKHKISIHLRPGVRFNGVTEQIPVKKVAPKERTPVLLHYYDNTSETQDEQITVNGGGRIVGTDLKFDADDVAQGIFFVNTATGAATRVDSQMLRNKPAELIFLNPPVLAAGTYRLEVRSLLNTLTLRTGNLSKELTVL